MQNLKALILALEVENPKVRRQSRSKSFTSDHGGSDGQGGASSSCRKPGGSLQKGSSKKSTQTKEEILHAKTLVLGENSALLPKNAFKHFFFEILFSGSFVYCFLFFPLYLNQSLTPFLLA